MARTAQRTGTARDVVNGYLDCFTGGDFEGARRWMADDFAFRGPFATYEAREPFFVGADGLRPILRGHRLRQQWEEGGDVCSFYELHLETPVGTGSVLASEWDTVQEGLVSSARLVFDTAEFRSLVPPR